MKHGRYVEEKKPKLLCILQLLKVLNEILLSAATLNSDELTELVCAWTCFEKSPVDVFIRQSTRKISYYTLFYIFYQQIHASFQEQTVFFFDAGAKIVPCV